MGPTVARFSFVDLGLVETLGTWDEKRSDPFQRAARIGLESLRYRESVIVGYASRRDPLPIRKDVFRARPRMVEIRRATLSEHRYDI